MSEIVNLNKARKARAQAEAKTTAAANRAKFGRTKGDRTASKLEGAKTERTLDGAKRED